MDLMRIPEKNRNFLELRDGIERLQFEYIEEKERADNLATNYPLDDTSQTKNDQEEDFEELFIQSKTKLSIHLEGFHIKYLSSYAHPSFF